MIVKIIHIIKLNKEIQVFKYISRLTSALWYIHTWSRLLFLLV